MNTRLQNEYQVKRRVTLVCAALNLLLAGLKLILGVVGQSQALFADGIHSLSDLASDAMVLVAIRFASDEADEDHPYGHARFETVATVILGLLLLLVAAGIVMDAAERISNPELLSHPGFLALAGAAVSIGLNEWMYWYSLRAAEQVKSDLMRANAWHHRSDAISPIIVLIGIAGSMAGFPALDAVGAIGVSLLIGKIGLDLAWAGIRELVDTGATAEQLEEITSTMAGVEGVEAFHDLRTRRMGQRLLVEVHVLVGSQVTVSEGHMTGDRVHAELLRNHPYISEVLVHVDPEDDASGHDKTILPSREEILQRLEQRWQGLGMELPVERVNFHYLKGVIDVEVVLPLEMVHDLDGARRLAQELAEASRQEQLIGEVDVFFR
jgi:cation diffusion facilitator family transporter